MEPIVPDQDRKKSYVKLDGLEDIDTEDVKKSDTHFSFSLENKDDEEAKEGLDKNETGFCQEPTSTTDFT